MSVILIVCVSCLFAIESKLLCLKYILSTENSRDDGWLTVKDLTESIDRFAAAKDDAFKPRAYAIGQTPYKPIQKPPSDFVLGLRRTVIPRNQGQMPQNKPQMSPPHHASRSCYECGRPGHVRPSCPSLKKPASYIPHASSKRADVIVPRLLSCLRLGEAGRQAVH